MDEKKWTFANGEWTLLLTYDHPLTVFNTFVLVPSNMFDSLWEKDLYPCPSGLADWSHASPQSMAIGDYETTKELTGKVKLTTDELVAMMKIIGRDSTECESDWEDWE